MSLLLILQNPGEPVTVRFDVVLSETHEEATEITDHPVEEGVDISDHARPELARLTIEAKVSNTPTASNEDAGLSGKIIPTPPSENYDVAKNELEIAPYPLKLGNPVGQALDAVGGLVKGGGKPSATLFGATSFKDRVRETYKALKDAKNAVTLIRVESKLEEYDNMVIQHLTAPRAAKDGTAMTFLVELRELQTVRAKTVKAPLPAEPLGFPLRSLGSQSGKDDKKDSEKRTKLLQSFAAGGFDDLRGAIGL